eukprot:gene15951-26917_t
MLTQLTTLSIMVAVVASEVIPPMKLALYPDCGELPAGTESGQSEQQHEVWEPSLVNAMKARLGPGKHFVDIGANEGYFSLYAAALGATITAFEPVKHNANVLKIAACLNRFTTITLVNVGLAEKEQTCKMNGIFMACTDVEKVIGGNRHENVDVHVQRLDSYIKTHVDVLKIDIEGFEEGAMRGGSKAWELAAVGAPDFVAYECNADQMKKRGYSTMYWKEFAGAHGCWFDFSFEWYVPRWVSGVPMVTNTILNGCGGANHAIVCKPNEVASARFTFLFSIAAIACFGIVVFVVYCKGTLGFLVATSGKSDAAPSKTTVYLHDVTIPESWSPEAVGDTDEFGLSKRDIDLYMKYNDGSKEQEIEFPRLEVKCTKNGGGLTNTHCTKLAPMAWQVDLPGVIEVSSSATTFTLTFRAEEYDRLGSNDKIFSNQQITIDINELNPDISKAYEFSITSGAAKGTEFGMYAKLYIPCVVEMEGTCFDQSKLYCTVPFLTDTSTCIGQSDLMPCCPADGQAGGADDEIGGGGGGEGVRVDAGQEVNDTPTPSTGGSTPLLETVTPNTTTPNTSSSDADTGASTDGSAPLPEEDGSTPTIVGLALGGVVLLLVIAVVVRFYQKRNIANANNNANVAAAAPATVQNRAFGISLNMQATYGEVESRVALDAAGSHVQQAYGGVQPAGGGAARSDAGTIEYATIDEALAAAGDLEDPDCLEPVAMQPATCDGVDQAIRQNAAVETGTCARGTDSGGRACKRPVGGGELYCDNHRCGRAGCSTSKSSSDDVCRHHVEDPDYLEPVATQPALYDGYNSDDAEA